MSVTPGHRDDPGGDPAPFDAFDAFGDLPAPADEDDEHGGKRDRLGRFYRIVQVLQSRGEQGARTEEIARLVGMSKRTVYRDLKVLEREMKIPLWSENGRWGLEEAGLLPALKLTRSEAMAVFLSARLMVRYADEYDADLAGAFQKLESALPKVLAGHVARTLDVMSRRGSDPAYTRKVQDLTRAWAERRVVVFTYDASVHDPARERREARVHPWYIEPSLTTHALYLFGWDETRNAPRTFKIDRIHDLAVTTQTFEPPADTVEEAFTNAWDIIADQPVVEVVLRFDPAIAARVGEAIWHPSQVLEPQADGSLVWRGRVSGTIEIRLWILSWGSQVEVIAPADLRDDVAATYRAAAARYDGTGAAS